MIGWCAWLVLAPLVVLADGLLLAGLTLRVDLAAGLAMFFAFSCRGRALPGPIALLAPARAVLSGGGVAAQRGAPSTRTTGRTGASIPRSRRRAAV